MKKTCRNILKDALLVIVCVLLGFSNAAGMGLDFGGGGSSTSEVGCTPEESPVIVPGPLGSPLRIQPVGSDRYLVADYKNRVIFEVSSSSSAVPMEFFAVQGKPLSVIKVSGSKGAVYLVGNDDTKTIDQYLERKGQVKRGKSLFRKTPVQALDMAIDENTGLIYLVDGLAGEVKVINPSGRLVKAFGGFGQLTAPKGIALDLANNAVIISDYGDSKVGISASLEVFSLAGDHLSTITGNFSRPQGLSVANGKIYLADAVLGQVLEFDRTTGQKTGSYGCFGAGAGHLLMPMDVAISSGLQELLVADNRNGRITTLPITP